MQTLKQCLGHVPAISKLRAVATVWTIIKWSANFAMIYAEEACWWENYIVTWLEFWIFDWLQENGNYSVKMKDVL